MGEPSPTGVLLRRALATLGGPVGKFVSAVTVGLIGSIGLVTYSPQIIFDTNKVRDAVLSDAQEVQRIARPDPWTGEQGRETRRLAQNNQLQLEKLRAVDQAIVRRIETLERKELVFDQHVQDAREGYARIRNLENRLSRAEAQIESLIHESRQDRWEHKR